jgi:hypothetical protein
VPPSVLPPERPTPRARPVVDRVRALCLAHPEVTERASHGEAAWFVGRQFVVMSDHHHDDRIGLWAAAPEGAQARWVDADPERYFVPPYVGGRGWIGAYLDVDPDWDQMREIIEEAYRTVAPGRLLD